MPDENLRNFSSRNFGRGLPSGKTIVSLADTVAIRRAGNNLISITLAANAILSLSLSHAPLLLQRARTNSRARASRARKQFKENQVAGERISSAIRRPIRFRSFDFTLLVIAWFYVTCNRVILRYL